MGETWTASPSTKFLFIPPFVDVRVEIRLDAALTGTNLCVHIKFAAV